MLHYAFNWGFAYFGSSAPSFRNPFFVQPKPANSTPSVAVDNTSSGPVFSNPSGVPSSSRARRRAPARSNSAVTVIPYWVARDIDSGVVSTRSTIKYITIAASSVGFEKNKSDVDSEDHRQFVLRGLVNARVAHYLVVLGRSTPTSVVTMGIFVTNEMVAYRYLFTVVPWAYPERYPERYRAQDGAKQEHWTYIDHNVSTPSSRRDHDINVFSY